MRLQPKYQEAILILIFGAMLLTSGCSLIQTEQISNIIMVKPGDPVWLVEDVENVAVLARDCEGKFKRGVTKLQAGSTVWYDQKWNDTTIKEAD